MRKISDAWARGRVGIVMMGGIGDAVHLLPVVGALKRHAPACHITLILRPEPASLMQGHPAVDEVLVLARTKGWRKYRHLGLSRRRFDLVLTLQVNPKAFWVTLLARAPVKLGFDRARAKNHLWLVTTHQVPPHRLQHMQDQQLEFLVTLGVSPEPLAWELGPWPEEREAQRRFFAPIERPVATLVIGTTDHQRDWMAQRWAAVSDALFERHGLQPVLAGGRTPGEIEIQRGILALARHRPLSTLGFPLRDLVWLLDGSALVISPDTGPMHMAVALDRPVIALCGHWSPKRSGPYRRFQDLVVDAYGDPGEDYSITDATRPDRMARIEVEDVLARVELWKARYARVR